MYNISDTQTRLNKIAPITAKTKKINILKAQVKNIMQFISDGNFNHAHLVKVMLLRNRIQLLELSI